VFYSFNDAEFHVTEQRASWKYPRETESSASSVPVKRLVNWRCCTTVSELHQFEVSLLYCVISCYIYLSLRKSACKRCVARVRDCH